MKRTLPPRSTRKPLNEWRKDPAPRHPTKKRSAHYGPFYGRTVDQKVTQLPLSPDASPLPKALKEALHTDPNYHTPTNAKPLQGRLDSDGKIISPTLIMTEGGTQYRESQEFVDVTLSRIRLFEEVNEATDARFSDPDFHFRNRASSKKRTPEQVPPYEELARADLPAEVTLRQTVTEEVLDSCKAHKRVPATKIFSTTATLYRASVTQASDGVPNLQPAEASHLIAGSMKGSPTDCASASTHHNTTRLVTNEAVVRLIVKDTGIPVELETRATFKRDPNGRPTKVLDKEFNKITVVDPVSGSGGSVSFNYKDTQNNGAVSTSLNHLATNLALHSLFGKTKPKTTPAPNLPESTSPERKRPKSFP